MIFIRIFIAVLSLSCVNFSALQTKPTRYEPSICIDYAHKILCPTAGHIDTLLFVPDKELEAKMILLGLIHAEQRAISMAAFRVTDPHLAQALILAHKRGVAVRLIVDSGAVDSPSQKISQLYNEGIPIKVYYNGQYSIMHHKFFIFKRNLQERSIVWYGSANATIGGMIRNHEAVHVWSQHKAVDSFKQQFDKLEQSPKVTLLKIPTIKVALRKLIANRLAQRLVRVVLKNGG